MLVSFQCVAFLMAGPPGQPPGMPPRPNAPPGYYSTGPQISKPPEISKPPVVEAPKVFVRFMYVQGIINDRLKLNFDIINQIA